MKKTLLTLICILLTVVMLFSLVGCGKSDEQAIKDDMTNLMNDFKIQFSNPDSGLWKSSLKETASSVETVGLVLRDFVAVWSEGFSYKLGDVRIDGNNATIEVTVTCKQFSPAVMSASELMIHDPEAKERSILDNQKVFGERILSELRKSTPKSTTVTIPYTKSGKTWLVSSTALDVLAKALE